MVMTSLGTLSDIPRCLSPDARVLLELRHSQNMRRHHAEKFSEMNICVGTEGCARLRTRSARRHAAVAPALNGKIRKTLVWTMYF